MSIGLLCIPLGGSTFAVGGGGRLHRCGGRGWRGCPRLIAGSSGGDGHGGRRQ